MSEIRNPEFVALINVTHNFNSEMYIKKNTLWMGSQDMLGNENVARRLGVWGDTKNQPPFVGQGIRNIWPNLGRLLLHRPKGFLYLNTYTHM